MTRKTNGFALIDLIFTIGIVDDFKTVRGAIELVCDKFGLVLVVLGVMHFGNLYVLNRLRRRGLADARPPLPPDARISVQPGF